MLYKFKLHLDPQKGIQDGLDSYVGYTTLLMVVL